MTKVRYNIRNLHVSPITALSDNNVPTYATPIALPGTVSLTLDASGESTPFYADGVAYVTLPGVLGYTGTLEVAQVNETILMEVYGYKKDDNGAYVEIDTTTKEVGLQFEMDNETGNPTKFTIFRTSLTRPNINAQTAEESQTINPQSVDLTVSSVATSDGTRIVKSYSDSGASNYEDYYSAIALPTFTSTSTEEATA